MENGKNITASELERRIAATQEELVSCKQQAGKIPKRKANALGAATIDEKLLAKIEEDEANLGKRIAYLSERLPLLRQQQEAASASEAQHRIDVELPQEAAKAAEQYRTHLASFKAEVEHLSQSVTRLLDLYKQHQATADEQEFLLLLHDRFDLQPAPIPQLEEQLPDAERTSDGIFKPLLDFERVRAVFPFTEWARKYQDLASQRFAEKQARQGRSVGGHLRETFA